MYACTVQEHTAYTLAPLIIPALLVPFTFIVVAVDVAWFHRVAPLRLGPLKARLHEGLELRQPSDIQPRLVPLRHLAGRHRGPRRLVVFVILSKRLGRTCAEVAHHDVPRRVQGRDLLFLQINVDVDDLSPGRGILAAVGEAPRGESPRGVGGD